VTIVQVNGVGLHVQELAPGGPPRPQPPPTAVLIHGMAGDDMASWYFTLAQPLAAAGMRVLLYDLRGHGRSERPAQGYRFADFVEDLAALLAAREITGKVCLFGNSFGGTVAFGFAALYPERVRAIVAVESAPPIPAWLALIGQRLDRATASMAAASPTRAVGASRVQAETAAGAGARPDDRDERLSRRARRTNELLAATVIVRELPASALPDPERITAVACPVLCLYGGDSALRDLAAETGRLLPQAHIAVLPGQRHSLLIDRPDLVRGHILPWLAELGIAGSSQTP
jgi:pimeloyl-ACP methyl ester carboxylesterase